MRRTLVAAVCLSLALAGCKAKEAFDKASISNDLDKRGTTDLMKEVANDSYDAPPDGKLTEAQVQMYLKVREHEKKIVQVAKAEAQQHADKAKKSGEKSLAGMMEGFKAIGSVADLMTADIRAAKDLGFNTQEYLWVTKEVLEASGAAVTEKMSRAMSASFDQAYEQAKKARDEAKDETTKKMYAELLAGYDKSKAEMASNAPEANPSIAHNRALLAKYENELSAFANEFAKFEEKEGDTQKAVSEWQQKLDAAAKK